jgi:hypothetical protein
LVEKTLLYEEGTGLNLFLKKLAYKKQDVFMKKFLDQFSKYFEDFNKIANLNCYFSQDT